MDSRAGNCEVELKPFGVVELYADLLENITGVRPDMLASGSKGKNLQGAKLALSAIGGDVGRVRDVLEKVIALRGPIPNMMVVAGAVVEASYALDTEDSRAAYDRAATVEEVDLDGWEL
jgi:hypothetical protein